MTEHERTRIERMLEATIRAGIERQLLQVAELAANAGVQEEGLVHGQYLVLFAGYARALGGLFGAGDAEAGDRLFREFVREMRAAKILAQAAGPSALEPGAAGPGSVH